MSAATGSMGPALLEAGWTYDADSDAQCGAISDSRRGTGDCARTAKWRKGTLIRCAAHATRAEREGGTR